LSVSETGIGAEQIAFTFFASEMKNKYFSSSCP